MQLWTPGVLAQNKSPVGLCTMPNTELDPKLLKALNDLISTCYDAEEGYAKAAKGVHNPHLSDRLVTLSDQRAQWAGELSGVVTNLGGEAATDGSFSGILHRGWVDLETRIRSKSEQEIVRECLAGETLTVKHYNHALSLELPAEALSTVQRQFQALQSQLQELEHLTQKGRVQHA
jgi:uncharacterized protein (TIGR02284 family)